MAGSEEAVAVELVGVAEMEAVVSAAEETAAAGGAAVEMAVAGGTVEAMRMSGGLRKAGEEAVEVEAAEVEVAGAAGLRTGTM